MSKRKGVEEAVGQVLDATREAQVTGALSDLIGRSYSHFTKVGTDINQAAEILRTQRQVLQAAVGELVCRSVSEAMSATIAAGRNLLTDEDYDHGEAFDEQYTFASPSLRRFVEGLYAWFRHPFELLLRQGAQGVALPAAILAAGTEFHKDYRSTINKWVQTSTQPLARIRRDLGFHAPETFRELLCRPFIANPRAAVELLIGRSVAHSQFDTPLSKAEFACAQFAQMSDFAGVVSLVSAPLVTEKELPLLYSSWEKGEISGDSFIAEASETALSLPNACYHASLAQGPWKNRGHCSADVRFMRRERFPVPPEKLLQQLGVDPIPEDITMTHVFLASGIDIAKPTIFANWPKPAAS